MADLETLKGLLRRVSLARQQDRRLDYELFCVFAEADDSNPWDPHSQNRFTQTAASRRCARLALSALIAQAEQGASR